MPSLKSRTTGLVVVVAVSCAAAYWAGSSWLGSGSPKPAEEQLYQVVDGLAVARAALDLGTVWEEKGFTCDLPIENRNATAVAIEDFTFS